MRWYAYIVRCRDGSLYTGATPDVAMRLEKHNAGRGARYTRARLPVKLVWMRRAKDKSGALSLEALVKQLPRAEKQKLVSTGKLNAELRSSLARAALKRQKRLQRKTRE